ncbi:MAG: S-adenosylmethionine:tRNA ribosyltransferase-isomerase, partial [Patescibacteria group bacterium]
MQDYEYYLPPELIAKEPAVPRDHSRLFIYNTQKNSIIFDHFSNLAKYLPQNSFLVLNETKVLP